MCRTQYVLISECPNFRRLSLILMLKKGQDVYPGVVNPCHEAFSAFKMICQVRCSSGKVSNCDLHDLSTPSIERRMIYIFSLSSETENSFSSQNVLSNTKLSRELVVGELGGGLTKPSKVIVWLSPL